MPSPNPADDAMAHAKMQPTAPISDDVILYGELRHENPAYPNRKDLRPRRSEKLGLSLSLRIFFL